LRYRWQSVYDLQSGPELYERPMRIASVAIQPCSSTEYLLYFTAP
jgi:hypothetical protein